MEGKGKGGGLGWGGVSQTICAVSGGCRAFRVSWASVALWGRYGLSWMCWVALEHSGCVWMVRNIWNIMDL